MKKMVEDAVLATEDEASTDAPPLNTVADVLAFAREKIAAVTGMPAGAIKADLKMGA